MSTSFTTTRLHLRAYDPANDEAELVDTLFSYDNMRISTRDVAPVRPKDRSSLIDAVNASLFFAIVETIETASAPKAVVGMVSLRPSGATRNRTANLAIAFKEVQCGRGYGTEVMQWLLAHAFDHLGLHRIVLEVLEDNPRAIAVYKKVGFVEEGRHRKNNWLDGKWTDLLIMGILEQEWLALEGQSQASV
ncbi:acyl-CoA N-acyltransferase [Auriculariales sp. MPI-PUGE-AT-0066]|nr:acyl-CoA N-acyltransferase [Auriculariales sp. MPI-PUGE-AT-0066]